MNRIKNISIFFKLIFQLLLCLLPILLITSWMYAPNELVLLSGMIKLDAIPDTYKGMHFYNSIGIMDKAILHPLSINEKILGGMLSAIPMLVNMYILFLLIKLFTLYSSGNIFSIRHVKYIRNIGYALLVGQVIEPFYQFAMGLVLTIHNPMHHRFAAITLDQTNIGIVFVALLVILISWIMAEGYKLQEEQQLII